jgi:hypothetical protein
MGRIRRHLAVLLIHLTHYLLSAIRSRLMSAEHFHNLHCGAYRFSMGYHEAFSGWKVTR